METGVQTSIGTMLAAAAAWGLSAARRALLRRHCGACFARVVLQDSAPGQSYGWLSTLVSEGAHRLSPWKRKLRHNVL
jgi:hypothetical protein